MLLGALIMLAFSHRLAGPVYMALAGVSSELGSPVKSALQAEIYGTERLGAVRSLFSSFLVFSTALGPPLYGMMLDVHGSYSIIFLFSASVFLGITLLSFYLAPDHQPG
ncbi:MAG: hypothetical protein HY808_14085 [Nitrospirae bacterium]|nr:hypothetical protein [Nitrospirota bacterium]